MYFGVYDNKEVTLTHMLTCSKPEIVCTMAYTRSLTEEP